MKVLYICADLGIPILGGKGGAVHVRSLVAALSRAGHDVLVTSPILNKSPFEQPATLDGALLHIPPNDEIKEAALTLKSFNATIEGKARSLSGQVRRILYNQQLEKRLLRKFDSHPPDFIYERCSLFSTAGVSLASAIDRPLIIELNAPLPQEQAVYRGSALNELAVVAEKWTLSHAAAVMAVSEQMREYAIFNGAAPERVHVLPNGVDTALFHPSHNGVDPRKRWGIGDGPILGFIGGLRPWHGVEVLPDVLASLLPRFPNLKLVIAGEGPLRRDLQDRLAARGISQHAVLTGMIPHDEIPHLIRYFDIALAPYPKLSHEFYFSPLKLFEYMACGVPVVASAVGQIADIVQHDENGLLYQSEDVGALTTACGDLLTNRAKRRRLGASGAAFVARNYTWDRNAQQVIEVAKQLSKRCELAV